MATVASKISFYQFANLLEKLSKMSGDEKKKNLLKSFVKQWRDFEYKLRENKVDSADDSFFPAMRFLLPQLDKDREAYGIKEYTLAKYFIKIFGLGAKSPAASSLTNYKNPKSGKYDLSGGDFANAAYQVLKDRCPEKGRLTIAEVNAELDHMAAGHVTKDHDRVQKSLLHLMKNVSSQELKWLVRIILKEMRIGLGQRSIFHSYHRDAEEVYNVKMSLEKVCSILKDPEVRLHEIEVSLFSPFRPMLAQRSSPDEVEAVMGGRPYFVEVKFDGERMQLHVSDGEFKYFSRGGVEYTQTYGHDRLHGNTTPHVIGAIDASVVSCILDGEMVGWNPEDGTIGTKGENFDIKSPHLEKYQPMYVVFDILYLNGRVLSNVPLRGRRESLRGIIKEIPGRIVISEIAERNTNQECIDALNEAMDKREEGIMIKDPDSVYKPNSRNKGGWYKLKPEYVVGHSDDLDLLVVGGYFGIGSSMVTHFLCAVCVDPPEGGNPREFHTFSKVGSGYTNRELSELNQKLSSEWIAFQKTKAPDWLKFPGGFKQKPDVVVKDPSKSIVFQVKAAEIIQSDQYKTGTSLRFPRVVKIRYDKPWYDCMTLGQLEQLKNKFDGKLTGLHVAPGYSRGKASGKMKRRITTSLKPTVDKRFRGVDQDKVEKTSALFDGKEMCILSGDDVATKSQLEEMVVRNGGTIVQNPGDETFCVVSGKSTAKVNNVVKVGVRDVVKSVWLLRCSRRQRFLPWLPFDMMNSSAKTKVTLESNYDRYGDGFYEEAEEESLKLVFEGMTVRAENLLGQEQMRDLELKCFGKDGNIFGLFRSYRARFQPQQVNSLSKVLFKLHGGSEDLGDGAGGEGGGDDVTMNFITISITSVASDSHERHMNEEVRGVDAQDEDELVDERWILDSLDAKEVLDRRSYLISR